jgi:hypothetical protein
MPGPDWHWEQGTKYVVEGVKALTILNGGAAIALMTFGNSHKLTHATIFALACFAIGAAMSVFTFFVAYRAQLEYGNAELYGNQEERLPVWRKGQRWNNFAYFVIAASFLFFAMGLFAAASGLSDVGVVTPAK